MPSHLFKLDGWVVDGAGRGPGILAGNGGVDWDANGFIYFAGQEKDVVANPQTPEDHIKNAVANDVYKIRHDGTGLLRLAQTTDGAEADVGVSPDGSLVSYIREVINLPSENHTEVWVINPDGSNPRMDSAGCSRAGDDHPLRSGVVRNGRMVAASPASETTLGCRR